MGQAEHRKPNSSVYNAVVKAAPENHTVGPDDLLPITFNRNTEVMVPLIDEHLCFEYAVNAVNAHTHTHAQALKDEKWKEQQNSFDRPANKQ